MLTLTSILRRSSLRLIPALFQLQRPDNEQAYGLEQSIRRHKVDGDGITPVLITVPISQPAIISAMNGSSQKGEIRVYF